MKRLCSPGLAISPKCVRSYEQKETIEYSFCVEHPMTELIGDFMVRMLRWKFFVLEDSSIFSNVIQSVKNAVHYMLFFLLSVMRNVVWTTLQKKK